MPKPSKPVSATHALLGIVTIVLLAACGSPVGSPQGESISAPSTQETAALASDTPSPRAPRPAVEPHPDALAAARSILGPDARDARCGPYQLLTDVTDARLLDACAKIGAQLDLTTTVRLGLEPLGEPKAAILLFADGEDFRTFSHTEGRVAIGYAGFARPVRGYLAMWAGEPPYDSYATTLAHELAHLVQRRTLGPNLPPWLSEGLADAIGDPATLDGPGTLTGLAGVEGPAARLQHGYRNGQVGSVERLLRRHRGDFDAEHPSFDYEQSALLVRFLLLDAQLGSRFRTFLDRLAAGEDYEPELLFEVLAVEPAALDAQLQAWLTSVAR